MKKNYVTLILFLCFPILLFGHENHYNQKPGGELLGGYPWGVFSLGSKVQNRVEHKLNDQELSLANKIFENIGDDLQVAFPVKLEHMGYKPFGDGQSNGHADFSEWKEVDPPYIAVLDKAHAQLKISFHSSISAEGHLTILLPGGEKKYSSIEKNHFTIDIDPNSLNWDSLNQGQVVYIKPSHWEGWFPLKFQYPYIPNEKLAAKIPLNLKNGVSKLPNSFGLSSGKNEPPLIQLINNYKNKNYLMFTLDKVHAIYPYPNHPNAVQKTSAGNWTFLLNPDLWEHEPASTFKQLYSCFEGRAYWEESMKKTVSGTSWHHVGDPGEILLNSVDEESRSLVTAIGEPLNHNVPIAYGLTDVGYAAKLKPGQAFISTQGNYHWHPVHTPTPICIEVWTPKCKPLESNGYGFDCN